MLHFIKHSHFNFFYQKFMFFILVLTFFLNKQAFACKLNVGCQFLHNNHIALLRENNKSIPKNECCFMANAFRAPFIVLLAINRKLKNLTYSINPCFFSIPSTLACFKEDQRERQYLINHAKKLLIYLWLTLEFPDISQKIKSSVDFKKNASIMLKEFVINEDQYHCLTKDT